MMATAWARLRDLYSGLVGMVTRACSESSSSLDSPLSSRPATKRHRSGVGPGHQLGRSRPGAVHGPLGGPFPGGKRHGPDTVGNRFRKGVVDRDALNEVAGVVGDPLDPPGVEDLGRDQPHLLEPEILRDPHGAADVDDVLRGDQDEDRGRHEGHDEAFSVQRSALRS